MAEVTAMTGISAALLPKAQIAAPTAEEEDRGAVECLMTGPIASLSETENSSYSLHLLVGLPRFGST